MLCCYLVNVVVVVIIIVVLIHGFLLDHGFILVDVCCFCCVSALLF